MNRLIILVLFFSFISGCHSQSILVIDSDTLVTITPRQISIINGIFVEYEGAKREIQLRDSLETIDSLIIESKDEIIQNYKEAVVLEQEKSKKKSVKFGILGIVVGFIIGVFL